MASNLLPVGNEAPRCSDFARANELRPAGSGLFLERVILVSVPLPWPKPALKHELLEPSTAALNRSGVRSRLFAAEPWSERTDVIDVEVYERPGNGGAVRYGWQVDNASACDALLTQIAETDKGELAEVATADGDTPAITTNPRAVLVCTQGSHDLCCGTDGVELADQLSARDTAEVRRVSHTGGHRFAPTFLAFPGGRMWAFADLALVDRIVANQLTADDYRDRCRGWWGAATGAAQVAELAVRVETADQPFDDVPVITVEPEAAREPGPTPVQVQVAGTTWPVTVRVAREVPSISCQAVGGLPAKPGREFGWTIGQATPTDGKVVA